MSKSFTIQNSLKLKGEFFVKLFDASIVKTYSDICEKGLIKEYYSHNLVVNVGKNVFSDILANGDLSTNTGQITYLAVGTGLSSPATTDTQLETEIDRTVPEAPTPTVVNNVVTFDFFFAAPDAIGTLKEVGAFIDGTGVANSGVLFDRAQIDIEKTPLTSLLVQLVVTVV